MNGLDDFFKKEPAYTPQETVDRLKDELERRESSMDIAMRMYGLLKDKGSIADEFNTAYTAYYNGDEETIANDLVERAIKAALT